MSRKVKYEYVNSKVFSERLKSAIYQSDLTMEDIADDLCVSLGTVYWWCNGSLPMADTLIGLADELNCSLDYLFGRSEVFGIR